MHHYPMNNWKKFLSDKRYVSEALEASKPVLEQRKSQLS